MHNEHTTQAPNARSLKYRSMNPSLTVASPRAATVFCSLLALWAFPWKTYVL
jgi:hypothetical protein